MTLYRQPPFQIELLIGQPNLVVRSHCHPSVDSYEMYVGGPIDFTLDSKNVSSQEDICEGGDGRPKHFGMFVAVPHTQAHGGTFGPQGGVYLSFQHWLDGTKPTSVGLNGVDVPFVVKE